MVVVVVVAGGAMFALHAYNSTKASSPEILRTVIAKVKQQAGVMAAICGAIFTVIAALEGAFKPSFTGDTSSSLSGVTFGKRSNERPVESPATSVG